MKILVPPLKCQGIKTRLVPWILSNCPLPPKGRWIEPFTGSGVVGFNARPERALFNDRNPHVVRFYQALKERKITPEGVRRYLEREGEALRREGEARYYAIRERFNHHGDPLDFLFLCRAGYNGVIRFNEGGGFNVPFCRKPERFSKAYVTKVVNQVEVVFRLIREHDWRFRRGGFEAVIEAAGEEDLVYCDPPYLGRHAGYYDRWGERDEERLAHVLRATRARFVLSTWHSNRYRRNPSLERYWGDFRIVTREHFYHVGPREANRHAMLEALVVNFPPPRDGGG